MNRGGWHQCGDRSQVMARELLDQNIGVGVVISPRDLARGSAVAYAQQYHDRHAEVLFDPQFYRPLHTHQKVQTYEFAQFWVPPTQLAQLIVSNAVQLENALRTVSADLAVDAIVAPATMYEAGRPDLLHLNAQLFQIARHVGDQLGLPVYATVALATSVTSSDATTDWALGHVTSLPADGWYLVFEFTDERIPSDRGLVGRFLGTGLTLACTQKPVFHAFAGPMAVLSPAFGATGIGIGHCQNLWHIDLARFGPPQAQGGGGDAPARFFSTALWGTIVTPDELTLLPQNLRAQVVTGSPYSVGVGAVPPQPLSKWNANKHLVYSLGSYIGHLQNGLTAEQHAIDASALLANAVTLHAQIAAQGLMLRDNTNAYQHNWRQALQDVLQNRSNDYAYLALL